MISLSRFLVPTDFSDFSRYALEYAISLAKKCNAKITLLHVIDMNQFPPDLTLHHLSLDPEKLEEALVQESSEKLRKFTSRVKRSRLTVKSIVESGKPFVEIITTAREMKASLIIMGTHGLTGIAHALLGSTAEKVVRKAPCPVLTVKRPDHEFKSP